MSEVIHRGSDYVDYVDFVNSIHSGVPKRKVFFQFVNIIKEDISDTLLSHPYSLGNVLNFSDMKKQGDRGC
jgi:hypothetical protein